MKLRIDAESVAGKLKLSELATPFLIEEESLDYPESIRDLLATDYTSDDPNDAWLKPDSSDNPPRRISPSHNMEHSCPPVLLPGSPFSRVTLTAERSKNIYGFRLEIRNHENSGHLYTREHARDVNYALSRMYGATWLDFSATLDGGFLLEGVQAIGGQPLIHLHRSSMGHAIDMGYGQIRPLCSAGGQLALDCMKAELDLLGNFATVFLNASYSNAVRMGEIAQIPEARLTIKAF